MSKQKNMTGQIATLKKVMHYLKHYIPILILSVVLGNGDSGTDTVFSDSDRTGD